MKFHYILLTVLFSCLNIFPQPSGSLFRRAAILNGNSIRVAAINYGVLGQPGNIGPLSSWNGDHNNYFGDMSILLGVELPIEDYWMSNTPPDGIPDTIHSVIITPVNRPGGGESGIGKSWAFEPVDSFFNPADQLERFALSNYTETWPEIWPDHPEYGTGVWNGLYGPDMFVGEQEAFFKIDDFNDEENNIRNKFYPDPSDTTKKGHGLEVFVRYIQLDDPLFRDVLFKIYDIKNVSKHNYQKLVFGGLTGTYIGGEDPEWNDDVSLYYFRDNIIVSYDFDNYISPSTNPDWIGDVGMFGEAFIQAPSQNKIASFQYFVPAGDVVMSNDENLWQRMTPGYYHFPSSVTLQDSIPVATRGEDGDYFWASDYFSLDTNETKRIVSVIAFGYDKSEVLEKIKISEALFHSSFDAEAIHNAISITSHNYHKVVNGINQIKWQTDSNNGTVEIWYSPDAGKSWEYITKNAPNTGSYNWNTENIEDASFALLKIFLKDEEGFIYAYDNCNSYFTVNNSGNGKPFVKILNSEFSSGETFTQENYDFNLLVSDPESDPLLINVYYSSGFDTSFHYTQSINAVSDTIAGIYNIDFKSIPNSPMLRIKLEVTDGETSYSDITHKFSKQTPRPTLGSSNLETISGNAEVPIEIRVIDSSAIKGYEYIITFEDTLWNEGYKTFSAYNKTLNEFAAQDIPFYPFAESIPFDGMVLYAEDLETGLDDIKSGWNNPKPGNLSYSMTRFSSSSLHVEGYKDPFDYVISFSDEYNDSSNHLDQILGSGSPPANYNINFKLFKVINNVPERIQFVFTEGNNFRRDTLSFLDQITYSNPDGTELSWKLRFMGDSSSNIPADGDTLFLFTKKGLSKYDTLRIFDLPVGVERTDGMPEFYSLSQNYPNPFNPITTVRFEIPNAGRVVIKVFDILGRDVATLLNEEKVSGKYEVAFDASKLASGIYFCRLQAGKFVQTKKMVLLK